MAQPREVAQEEVKRGGSLDDSESGHCYRLLTDQVWDVPKPLAGWRCQLLRWEEKV